MEMTSDSSSAPETVRPQRLTREQSRARTRQRLLESAAVVFTREGYGGASLDRIAEEAGYSKGALYSNFDSKEELFFELVEHYGSAQSDELCARLDAAQGSDELIAVTCAWASGMRPEPDLSSLLLDLARRGRDNPALVQRQARFFDEQWAAVGTRLLRIFPGGESPVAPAILGALVMELAYGNAMQFHATISAGDLVGTALRALSKANAKRVE
jgi:AcrR family transcriptional regulator